MKIQKLSQKGILKSRDRITTEKTRVIGNNHQLLRIDEEVEEVDVVDLMDAKVKASKEKGLDWRHSIVDLLKLLDMDSSLKSRQALAKELDYDGDVHDSATMNVWLIKEVLTQVASNGGSVPEELTH